MPNWIINSGDRVENACLARTQSTGLRENKVRIQSALVDS